MKEIRIFVASSKELLPERNFLSYLTLAMKDEFERRGLRIRLSKWEYVDPRMTAERTEDRYIKEMYGCDAALVLFRNIAGIYTREELDKALAAEQSGTTRLKAHEILFAADGAPDSDAARLRAELPNSAYGVWSIQDELQDRFLALIDRVAQRNDLLDAPFGGNVRKITAFLAADDELSAERDAFADTVLNVNDLLELACRNLQIDIRFYDHDHAEEVLDASEMGLVIYGTNCRVFGREEIERIYVRVKEARQNPKRFYVFFRDLDEATEEALDNAFRTFRDDFVTKLGHFTCQFGDANALRLSFILSLERYAGESVKEYYSTVASTTAPFFAGRENELRKLCELLEPVPGKFPFGRLPVVTGAGGTGKSELVRQFAWQLRVQYPGGVFQVNMEHVRTWDDVFLGLLNGVPNNGTLVKDYLGIKTKESGPDKTEHLIGAKVRDALLSKARESGPILLVLDNVECFSKLLDEKKGGGFNMAFPSAFSERVRVNVIATARVCDVTLRETDWAVPFPLGDLSPEAALEILLGDRPDADEVERKAAERVAELLGYRALYLRRVPALIGDLYSQTFCDSYADLSKALEENLLKTVAEETEETHLPEVLWRMTRERLHQMPLGAECVKLAEVAAFFSPDGFPRHVLLHLWKNVVAPGLDECKFKRAFDIVRHHNIFQSADSVRLHRLDRAAILHEMGDACAETLDAIGRSLADYYGASPNIWLSLVEQFPSIFQWIPAAIVNGSFFVKLLAANPNCVDMCFWEKLDGWDWVCLLEKRPQFANRCPWEKLEGADWVNLLKAQPQFADRCSWDNLSGHDWVELLWGGQTQFADKCQWEKLSGEDWAYLWYEGTHFTDKCPLEKLTPQGWASLIYDLPQYADRCPWEELKEELSSWDWACLLGAQPQFADMCPWKELNGWDWALLLQEQPQFADRCPWEKLSFANWASLLKEQPQFADKCPCEKLDGEDCEKLDGEDCEKLDGEGSEKLNGEGSEKLDGEGSEKLDGEGWEKLDGEGWEKLLRIQPQFADRCPWEKLDGSNWAGLLEEQPQLADMCPWEELNGWDWALLLQEQPQFADRCPWEKFTGEDWAKLLGKLVYDSSSALCGGRGRKLLSLFEERCSWEKLDGSDWADLLANHPQFADRCPWDKLDSGNWAKLLDGLVNQHFARTMTGRGDYTELLGVFDKRCLWDKLDGGNWAELLKELPQLADRCLWNKLDDGNWAELLAAQPQFADKCPWNVKLLWKLTSVAKRAWKLASSCKRWLGL